MTFTLSSFGTWLAWGRIETAKHLKSRRLDQPNPEVPSLAQFSAFPRVRPCCVIVLRARAISSSLNTKVLHHRGVLYRRAGAVLK